MRGGEVCQSGFTCANGVVNGGKSFPEEIFPSPPGGIGALESSARRPMPWLQPTFGASTQKVMLRDRVRRELGESSTKDGVFPNAVPNAVVEVTHASADAFVLVGIYFVRIYHVSCFS